MADVKEDYSSDICLLQTAVNLGLDEAEVGVILGFMIKEMREYSEKTGYDPKTASDEESKAALGHVAVATQHKINENVTNGVSLDEILNVTAEFSEVVDKYKKGEK